MPAKLLDVPADIRARVRAFAKTNGIRGAAKKLSVTQTTVLRVVAGEQCCKSTIALISQELGGKGERR